MIGGVLGCLRERDIYDRTDIVITSDHGEEFYDHGKFGHSHYQCYDETLRVPLMVKAGNHVDINKHTGIFFSQVDLLPTVLAFFGISAFPDIGRIGRNIFSEELKSELPGGLIATSYSGEREEGLMKVCKAYREDGFKLKWCEALKINELYDLGDDPLEGRNIYKKKRDLAKKLKARCLEELHRAAAINQRRKAHYYAKAVFSGKLANEEMR